MLQILFLYTIKKIFNQDADIYNVWCGVCDRVANDQREVH